MPHKKQKLKKAKKEKEIWGDDDGSSDYFKQLSEDCSEQELAVLDHEPVQHCKKEKKATRKQLTASGNNGQDHETTTEKGSSTTTSSNGQQSKKKKNKQLSNSDYLDLLESSLNDEEKFMFHQTEHTRTKLSKPSIFTAQKNHSTQTSHILRQSRFSTRTNQSMEVIANLLKELNGSFELFKVQEELTNKQIILEKLVEMTDSLSRKCFQKEDRNSIFILGGLNFVCELITYFAFGENENEYFEKIVNSLSYILYRFSDHNRARSAMLTAGVFYSLWYVGGLSKNVSTISHVNEVINLLGGQLSIGYELGNLLKKANSQLLDVVYISSEENSIDFSSSYSDNSSFPDTFIGIGTDFHSLSENDFPIQLHYSIITARTINFLSDFCVKWDSTIDQVSSVENSKGPGFYLMKDPNVSWYSLLKFIQLIYTDKISISKEEKERVLGNKNSIFESKLISEGFSRLLSTLRNQKTRENAINCMDLLTSVEVYGNSETGGLFDEFDNELVKDEMNYFFGKPTPINYYFGNKIDTFTTEFLRKKEKIRKHSILLSGLEQDLGVLFMEMMNSQSLYREETKSLLFHPNVKILLTNTLGEIDYILDEHISNNPIFKHVIECKGFYLHKSILSTRSEFMKKLMQYELEQTQDGMDVVYINNFSLLTLFTVFQYMYSGLSQEGFPLLFTENLVECFLAADMFFLFGLKKYAEQKICEQISLETVEDLYYISIIYNSDLIKDKCIEIMANNNISFETDIKKLK